MSVASKLHQHVFETESNFFDWQVSAIWCHIKNLIMDHLIHRLNVL